MDDMSEQGSVCERGVVGRLEVMLSSHVLLSWRERALPSPMPSVSSARLDAASKERAAFSCRGSGREASVLVRLGRGISAEGEAAAVMALRRWMRSSCRALSFAGGGWGRLGVMAASCVYT